MANHSNGRMRPYRTYVVPKDEVVREEALIQSMVTEIRKAAVERRAMPYSESEDMTGIERARFRFRLGAAYNRAGVVLIAPPEPETPTSRRRRR